MKMMILAAIAAISVAACGTVVQPLAQAPGDIAEAHTGVYQTPWGTSNVPVPRERTFGGGGGGGGTGG